MTEVEMNGTENGASEQENGDINPKTITESSEACKEKSPDKPDDKDKPKDVKKKDRKSDRDDRDRGRDRDDRKSRRRSRSRSRSRDRGNRRRRSRSRDRRRDLSRERRRRDRERDRDASRERRRREREAYRARSPTPPRRSPPRVDMSSTTSGLSRITIPFRPKARPPRGARLEMSQEERDQRTVFIMQLSHRTQPEELEEFFSAVGTVRDVRVIIDSKTRRLKGIAFVEFWEEEAVALAIGLNGQKVGGAPLKIQATFAERNRAWEEMNPTIVPGGAPSRGVVGSGGPMKLYIQNLHTAVDNEMLRMIFGPFGAIDKIDIPRVNGVSEGQAFVSYRNMEDARRALEQLNNFELAGKQMNITLVNDTAVAGTYSRGVFSSITSEEASNFNLARSDKLGLMSKLAQGTGMQMPGQPNEYLLNKYAVQGSIATSCFMLSNLFDPSTETEPNWAEDIRQDVIDECNKAGGAVCHCFVDKMNQSGNVYVKCQTISSAQLAVNALHGRMFAGKVITAAYVPLNNYIEQFPDSKNANHPADLR